MSKIEWTDKTWNPVTGCDKVSQGCKNCYAEIMHRRLMHIAPHKYTKPFLGNVEFHHDELIKPTKWKKGKNIFVNSMSDLFHEDVPFELIGAVYAVMIRCPQHNFQILTKRPKRALEFFNWMIELFKPENENWVAKIFDYPKFEIATNVWIGVSCEDQNTADERIPLLMQIPAAKHFLSCEPLLGKIYLWKEHGWLLDWVIVGGESGHHARPMHPDWVRSLRDQCAAAHVPFFFKQWGEWIDNQNFPKEHVIGNYKQHVFGSGYFSTEVWKVGKSKTGNFLDGKQHLNFPV